MKHLFFALIVLCLCGCNANGEYDRDEMHEAILSERIEMVSAIVKAGKERKLCDDMASYQAYDKADSILKSIDRLCYMNALAKTYVANSYVFYGISYLDKIMLQSMIVSGGGDAEKIGFPSFDGYEELMDSDTLSWRNLSIMDAWSVYGISATNYVVRRQDGFAIERMYESEYDIDQIHMVGEKLDGERLFTYATVLNARCYFKNVASLYFSYCAKRNDGEFLDSARKRAIDIATELESFSLEEIENGKTDEKELLQIQLQCAKLINKITRMWIQQL